MEASHFKCSYLNQTHQAWSHCIVQQSLYPANSVCYRSSRPAHRRRRLGMANKLMDLWWSLKLLEHMIPIILMLRLDYICNSMTQLLDILVMRRHLLYHCPEQVLTEDRGSADCAMIAR
eukprot:scaffold6697_cov109-Skeletonema_dohrnii-CCMP3373.AAC.4